MLGRLKAIPEGDGNLLDRTCLLYLHEHAEANIHKNNGLVALLAGHVNKMATGTHSKVTSTMGELYLGVANDVLKVDWTDFPLRTESWKDWCDRLLLRCKLGPNSVMIGERKRLDPCRSRLQATQVYPVQLHSKKIEGGPVLEERSLEPMLAH